MWLILRLDSDQSMGEMIYEIYVETANILLIELSLIYPNVSHSDVDSRQNFSKYIYIYQLSLLQTFLLIVKRPN